MFISCRPVVHSREIIQRVTSGKRPILFVGLTMTMRWGEEGTTTCFGVHINKGKRHIPIIWSQGSYLAWPRPCICCMEYEMPCCANV